MSFSVSDEEIERIAKEIGLKVTIYSEKAGVYNTTTGRFHKLEEFFEEYKLSE